MADLIDRYIEDGALEYHKAARDSLRHLGYFKSRIGKYALVYLTPEMLLEERKRLVEQPTHRDEKRSPSTVNRYMSSLGGALQYACKSLRWINESPLANVLKLKEKPRKRRTLTAEEEIGSLQACRESKNPYLYCITLLALTTGARQGEILGLTWDCIDFDNRLAHIKETKNGNSRRIGLVDSVLKELERLKASRDEAKALVFASKTSFGKIDIKKAWQNALKKAGVEDFVFHGLRHHFCSIGGELGASGIQLRSQMGHSSSSMTDHYSHLDADATRFIGESIQQRLIKGLADE